MIQVGVKTKTYSSDFIIKKNDCNGNAKLV